MDILNSLILSLLSPMVLAFILGIVASLIRSDLKIPPEIYAAMTIYLLFAIGLKGGAKLDGVAFSDFMWPLIAALALSLAIPVWSYMLLRKFGKFDGVIAWRKLVLSIQHAQGIDMEDQHRTFLPFLAEALSDVEKNGLPGAASSFSPSHLHLNGGGDFVVGGPRGDNGLSGKKLVVDHYGPSIPIGGGALSGKDVWKVDRCGPLRARQVAKRLVATGHHEAKVHLGWAPGEDIPSLRDAFVRNDSGSHWLEVPASRLPRPDWFSIQSIVHDLELTSISWKKIPVAGTFVDPKLPWERI